MEKKKKRKAIEETPGEPGSSDFSWTLNEEEVATLSEAEVEEVKGQLRGRDDYVLEETETRNVIMVGRTRSGKSTTIGVLKDTCFKPEGFSIFSQTEDPKFSSFALMAKKKKFTINMIDTPGLFEQKQSGEQARDNQMIVRTIQECVEHEVTSVNSVMIFATFEGGINPNDIDALSHFLHLFGADGVNIALCITRSENRSNKSKEDLVSQLQKHSTLGKIISERKIAILFMGCVDHAAPFSDKNLLIQAYKRVYFMREKALQWIFTSESKRLLVDLPVLGGAIEGAESLLTLLIDEMHYFSEVKDFDLGQNQARLGVYKSNLTKFLQIRRAAPQSPKIPPLYEEMMQIARKIKARDDLKPNIKDDLIGHIQLK